MTNEMEYRGMETGAQPDMTGAGARAVFNSKKERNSGVREIQAGEPMRKQGYTAGRHPGWCRWHTDCS